MKREFYIKVSTQSMSEDTELLETLSELGDYNFSLVSPETRKAEKEWKEWLTKTGLTESYTPPKYREAIGTPYNNQIEIKSLIQQYLDNVVTTDRLLIVDRYIFPQNADSAYADYLMDIIGKYIPKLGEIIFITSADKHNSAMMSHIYNSIKEINPNIDIDFRFTDLFHDRFWISNYNGKGLLMGSSLNGYGKKYALIDYLNIPDVREVISELNLQGLLY